MASSLISLLSLGTIGGGGNAASLSRFLPLANAVTSPLHGITSGQILESLDHVPGMQLAYERRWSYYENEQYSEASIEARGTEAAERELDRATSQLTTLYLFIKSFYNPIAQVVDMDVDSIFGDEGVAFTVRNSPNGSGVNGGGGSSGSGGPGAVDGAGNEGRQEILDRIIAESFFETEVVGAVRCACVTGDAYLRIVPDATTGEVSIRYYPSDLARVIYSPHNRNHILAAFISYDYTEIIESENGDVLNETHNRTDVLTPETIYTFRDGELYPYDGLAEEYENILGEVPIVPLKNGDVATMYGVPTFNHVIATLDSVNEVFSFLTNIIKINADPTIVAEGVQPGTMEKGDSEDAHASTVLYINGVEGKSGNSMYMLEWKGNLPDVMGLLKEVKGDMVDSLPEMHVAKMQQQGAYSGQALNAMMFAFVRKIGRMRKYYRTRVSQALSMCLAAQAMLDGERQDFDWRDPDYAIDITFPSILPVDEDLLLNRVLSKLKAGLIGAQRALSELGYPADEIADILSEARSWSDAQAQLQIRVAKASRPIPNGPPNPPGASGGAGAKNANGGQRQAAKGTNNQPINRQLPT
jgi:hypothetical protein